MKEKGFMKRLILSSTKLAMFSTGVSICLAGLVASAAAGAEETKADNEVSFNAAVVSDYRYRGISQTRLQPALQGGADYTNNPSGLYAGSWLSTIKWTKDAGGSGDLEWDIYAGKRGDIVSGSYHLSYDVGVLGYAYPANGLGNVPGFANANTAEVYGQIGLGPAYAKYSYALSNLFGFVDSKGSGYLDLGANLDAGNGFTLNLHAGRQTVKNNGAANYSDWKLGLGKDFGFVSGALALVGTNAGKLAYASPANGKFMGKRALVLTVSKAF
jgi:uncharacterized protein (TIGR02001 family)